MYCSAFGLEFRYPPNPDTRNDIAVFGFPRGRMNRDCKQGLQLRLHFEFTLKEWGWFDAYERALKLMPVGPLQVHEFQQEANHAHAELLKTRHAYVEHMAECLVCSRRLVGSDAVVNIREKLHTSQTQLGKPPSQT